MSLLTAFALNHLVPALEKSLIAHEPDVQAAILDELRKLSTEIIKWMDSKLVAKSE